MNGRSSLVTFFLFLFLAVMILLQVLSMVQSDRLYERLSQLVDTWRTAGPLGQGKTPATSPDLPGEEYPGDEGDWLIWRLGAEPATLNPVTAKDIYADWITWRTIFESLLTYDLDEVELKPLLAESYKISSDGLEMTFRLRGDVCFSDGTQITADDVVFSYETIINPKVDAHNLANYFRPIKELTKIDNRTVKFILREPYFKGFEIAGLMSIFPKHLYQFEDAADFNARRSSPVGSGSYIFEKWDVGREIVLRRNEKYWGRKPKLKKLVYRVITNEVAALQALRSHKVDFLIPTSEQFVELSNDKEFVKEFRSLSYWNPGVGYSYIGWNQGTPFFKDRNVRLAMTHLIDRQAIIDNILGGLGRIVTGPFYVFSKQYDPTIDAWPYDPEKAKRLLDEAGWIDTDGDGIRDKDGVPFKFSFMIVSGAPVYERLGRVIKDAMGRAGTDLMLDPYEWSVFEERLNTRSFDATMLGWGGVVQYDPYQIWHSSQIEGRGSNRIGFKNAQADAIIEEARRTMDEERRNKLYHRFHQILHDEQPYTFFRARPSIRFLDRRFENVIIHKLGLDPTEWYVPREKQRYK